MSSFTLKAAINRRLALVSAGFLLCTSGAPAGQPAEDAQQQARDLLTGAVNRQETMAYKSPSIVVSEYSVSNIDPQENARRLILGMPNIGGAGPMIVPKVAESTPDNRRTYPDAQELARRMVLGDAVAKLHGVDSPR